MNLGLEQHISYVTQEILREERVSRMERDSYFHLLMVSQTRAILEPVEERPQQRYTRTLRTVSQAV